LLSSTVTIIVALPADVVVVEVGLFDIEAEARAEVSYIIVPYCNQRPILPITKAVAEG
jgi:hypothetical protein